MEERRREEGRAGKRDRKRMVEEGKNTIDLLNGIKHKSLKQNNIFFSDLNG